MILFPGSLHRARKMYEDPKHFYVTFSNVSVEIYPKKKIAIFTAELARVIVLSSSVNWEVRVCEFTYPPNNLGYV